MTSSPPPEAAAPVLTALGRLRDRALAAESGVLDALAVLGEPLAQRVIDEWLELAALRLRMLADDTLDQVARIEGGAGVARSAEPAHDGEESRSPGWSR